MNATSPMPAICQQCGYDLVGLPQEGACPECGQKYDKASRMGIASNAAREAERGDRIALYTKVGILVVLGLMALGFGGFGAWRVGTAGDWGRPLLIGGTVGFGMFAIAGLIWLIEFLDRR